MKELIEIIKMGNNQQLATKLKEDPSLASDKTEQGISILQFAAYCRNTEAISILREHKTHLDIFEAATLGETKKVRLLLDDSPELLDSHSVDGFTLLGLASFFGHLDLAEDLLKAGANPNRASNNPFKVAPLHSACATSNVEMSALLLRYGANVNAKQMQGVTPLHSAAHNGQTRLVQLLVDHGADIEATTDKGQTPLLMAKEANLHETAGLLEKLEGK